MNFSFWNSLITRYRLGLNVVESTSHFHCSFAVKGWLRRARHHLVPTQSNWSELGRSGRSAPKQFGPSPHASLVCSKRPSLVLCFPRFCWIESELMWLSYRFWSGSIEGWQLGDLLAVRWIATSSCQHTVQVRLCLVSWLQKASTTLIIYFVYRKKSDITLTKFPFKISKTDRPYILILSSIMDHCHHYILFFCAGGEQQ